MGKGKTSRYLIWVYLLAALVFLTTNLISLYIFNRTPHIHDEAAYNFQAKIFIKGQLYISSPCAKEIFDFPHVVNNGRWYSQYPQVSLPSFLSATFSKHPGLTNSLIAGFDFLMAFLIRPYESVLFAIPPAIYLLFLMIKEPKNT